MTLTRFELASWSIAASLVFVATVAMTAQTPVQTPAAAPATAPAAAPAPAPAPNAAAAQAPTPAPAAPPAGGRGTPGTESGWATFQGQCFRCHGLTATDGAPAVAAIRLMTPERIKAALGNAATHAQAQALSDIQRQRIGEFMGSRPLGSVNAGDARDMPNRCTANPAMADPSQGPGWNGWGNDLANSRFQPAAAAKLTAPDVRRLELKWAFGYPNGLTSNAQPAVVAGRVFAPSDNGYIYALDAKTGCIYWSFQNGSIIRNAPAVGAVSGQGSARWAVFFGDGHANIFALDAQTGRQLWKVEVDDHIVARITAGVRYHDGRLYVPVSSSEEFNSGSPDYPCCTSRGSVVALDANTGRQIWKTYVVPGEPKLWKTQANGVPLYAPAGGGIWDSPTIDTVRGALYVGTGDAVTPPEPATTDAVMALDLRTGRLLWAYQATRNDLFMGGCNAAQKSEACPSPMGPDMDIGNSPILVTLPSGKRAVFAGTKGADVIALDPDDNGRLLFRVNPAGIAVGGTSIGRGSIMWGGAADGSLVYYGLGAAGLAAVRPDTGATAWRFTPPGVGGRGVGALGAAPTAIPGVVFQGAGDGRIFAVSAADGTQLWEFNTAQSFDTVNKVTAKGGALTVGGAVVVDGMVYVSSGYGISSGAAAGNLLLAFGVR